MTDSLFRNPLLIQRPTLGWVGSDVAGRRIRLVVDSLMIEILYNPRTHRENVTDCIRVPLIRPNFFTHSEL